MLSSLLLSLLLTNVQSVLRIKLNTEHLIKMAEYEQRTDNLCEQFSLEGSDKSHLDIEERIESWLDHLGVQPETPRCKMHQYHQEKRLLVSVTSTGR